MIICSATHASGRPLILGRRRASTSQPRQTCRGQPPKLPATKRKMRKRAQQTNLVSGHVELVAPRAEHGAQVGGAHVGLERQPPPAVRGQVVLAERLARGLAGSGARARSFVYIEWEEEVEVCGWGVGKGTRGGLCMGAKQRMLSARPPRTSSSRGRLHLEGAWVGHEPVVSTWGRRERDRAGHEPRWRRVRTGL
jgi:hypothetical protein